MDSKAIILSSSAVAALSLLFYCSSKLKSRDNHSLPPGPPSDPLIGHVRQIPFEYPWKTFSEWAQKYGSIVYFHALGRPMLLLNTVSEAKELMDKKALNYSDRPPLIIMTELMGWDTTIAFMRYGDRFKRQRRLIEQTLTPKTVSNLYPLLIDTTYTLLGDLLSNPALFTEHFKKFTLSSLMITTYGYKVQPANDPYLRLIERVMRMTVEAGSHGSTLVDFFPFLVKVPSWMPGAGFKRHAAKTKVLVRELLDRPFNMVKQRMDLGEASPCLIAKLLDENEQSSIDLEFEEDIKAIGATLLAAGFETTASSLMTFLLAMVLYPEVVQKAQKEIDSTIGRDRLPDLNDRPSLQFIDSIIKETLRWNSPTPLGIPHRAMRSDMHRNYFIPAGTVVIANIWHMMYDEDVYMDPNIFDPDRFTEVGAPNPRDAAFGFGRRACPGQFLADAELYLAISNILAVFNILPDLDSKNAEIIPAAEFTTGNASQPKPFTCRIAPRDKKSEQLIRQYCSAISD